MIPLHVRFYCLLSGMKMSRGGSRKLESNRLKDTYGPWAVVTGAAQGIGEAFALHLAKQGLNVGLVDIQGEKIRTVATAVENLGAVARCIETDLAEEAGWHGVYQHMSDVEVGLLVNAAMVHSAGAFHEEYVDTERIMRHLNVGVGAYLGLTALFLPKMIERGRGGIIVLSSMVAVLPSPYLGLYCGCKGVCVRDAPSNCSPGFISNWGVCIQHELKEKNIDVVVVEPGKVDTPSLRSHRKPPTSL